ncbi:MAG: DEDD exonuclease domain-containing protein [Acidimicrobiales bacterium]|nr:DEDD exonuclease domain-containing protein [Acidimicrobiales bacterium]
MSFGAPPIQQSLDGLGIPLAEATFCVLDLETTGGDAASCGITEIGAVKVRGGDVLGTFQTMVNPGCGIPPKITMVTGITDLMVMNAPAVNAVLPTFLDFIGGSVIVGHNIGFDMRFISSAIRRWGGPMLGNQQLDTLALARRLLTEEVPRFKLGELAKRLRLPHQPCHRALDDAWATVDLLHFLIERASAWGVTGLDDLIALPTVAGHPQWKKLSLTTQLPRKPGVYFFTDSQQRILYVGKATDLRARVRSYFSSERRRKIPQLLRETAAIEHEVCSNSLQAELLELRLIQEHTPRFNRRGTRPLKPQYVKLTTGEAFPRLSVVRSTKGPGVYLGPISNRRTAELVLEAIQTVVPLRRCTTKISRSGAPKRAGLCTAAQLGKAACPCTGELSVGEYEPIVADAARLMTTHPHLALERLRERMETLAAAERFEDAALTRNRAGAFASAVERTRRLEMVDRLGTVSLELDRGVIRIESSELSLEERLVVGGWLDRHAARLRIVEGSAGLASQLPRLGNFTARKAPTLSPSLTAV